MSFLGSVGGVGRVSTALLRHKLISATAGTAAAVIVAGCAFAATSAHASGQEKLVNAGDSKQLDQADCLGRAAARPSRCACCRYPPRAARMTPTAAARSR